MPKNFPPPTTPTQMYRTPYYINNPPRVIPINLGRQLFVDNFLIAQTTLTQTQHPTGHTARQSDLHPRNFTIPRLNFMVRQKNSWVHSGSGSLPSE